MWFKKFFHKIKIGFIRASEPSVPQISGAKRYGNYGEEKFVGQIRNLLPSCKIKMNVMIRSPEGNAEIDCLVLYGNKLFAIEIKNWKGSIVQRDDLFEQEKTDRWTGEKYLKNHGSPFKQLKRSIYLLKKNLSAGAGVWINPIVFFEDAGNVFIQTEDVWFVNVEELVSYIKYGGRGSDLTEISACFEKSRPADYLYAHGQSLRCKVFSDSLCFRTENEILFLDDIACIDIRHHWSCDELLIRLKDGGRRSVKEEHAKIKVDDNGKIFEYALCKLDFIELGTSVG